MNSPYSFLPARIFAAIALLFVTGFSALTAQQIKGRPFIKNYGYQDYNAGLQNWQVGQDDQGIMYFANNTGLLMFDGVSWRALTTPQQDNIRSFDIAADGRIYIGSAVTFGYFERDSLGYFSYVSLVKQSGIHPDDITEVWTTYHSGDQVYFQSRTRIYRMRENEDGSWDVRTWEPGVNDLFMYAFYHNGEYFVHQRGVGLLKMVGDDLKIIDGSEVIANDRMQVMIPLEAGPNGSARYLISQFQKGMYIFDGASFEKFETSDPEFVSEAAVYKGASLPNGNLILATLTGGALVLDQSGTILDRYDENSGILGNSVYSVFIDNGGALWLGLSNGISRIDIASPRTQFTADDGISATPFSVRTYNGNLYVGTGNYLLKYNHDSKMLEEVGGVPSAQIFSIEVVDQCILFTGRGLFQLCDGELEVVRESVAGDFQCRFVTQGIKDPDILYIGTIEGMAVFRRINPNEDRPRWQYLGKVEETLNAEVRSILPLEDGSVWINGFTSGLFRMIPQHDGSASPDKPYTIDHYDEDDGLVDGGAALLKIFNEVYFAGLDTCYRFDEAQGRFIPIPDFEEVHYDSDDGGAFFAIPFSDDKVLLNMGGTAAFTSKNAEGGLVFDAAPFSEFQGIGLSDMFYDRNGQLWMTTNDAVIEYDPGADQGVELDFKTIISEVRVANKRISVAQLYGTPGDIPKLQSDHEAIRFDFAGPFFVNEERTVFRFWLEGFTKTWSDWGNEKYKEYTNLPPGEYTFHAQARNLYGTEGAEVRYTFYVNAPWYSTWWAYALYIIAGISFIVFIVRMRTSQLKRRSEELEATVAERTNEISRQVKLQEGLFTLSSKIAAAETESEICSAVVDGLQADAFDFPYTAVIIKEPSSSDLVLKASSRWKVSGEVLTSGHGRKLFGKVFKSGHLEYIPDVDQAGRTQKLNGRGSEVDVPIKVGDEVVGVLVVEHDAKDAFDKADLDILTTAASQASVALGQAYSHGQVEQRLKELGTVDEISQLITAKLNQKQLFELIGEQMREIFKAQIVYIALYDEKSGMITFPWQYGDVLTPMQFGEGLTSRVIRDNKPLLINEEMSARHEQMGIAPKGVQAESYLGVPIPADDKVIGVISVQSTETEGRFDENDMRLLQTIATHVGIAIQNAGLFEELERAMAEAEQANEAKSAFLSTVSHELRTPLTSVLGFAKIIRKRLEEKLFPMIDDSDSKVVRTKHQVMENLDVVVSEGERLTGLINDVLDLAKIEAGKIEWHMADISLSKLVERAVASTSSLFEESPLELKLDIESDLPDIWGDENKLLQVLINLLSNAVKFTDEGFVTVRGRVHDDRVVLSVTDTGAGITPEDQTKIFDKFKQVGDTLTDKPKGTGLGLPISKEIVEHHGGTLWVESEEGKGSTFSFSLPLKDSEPSESRPIDLGKLVSHLKSQIGSKTIFSTESHNNILVVDDEVNIRSLLHQELSEAGFTVQEARNGKEALDKIRKAKPDLIILDVMMPEMNGFDLAAVLKNDPETMEIPIIILSVLQDQERGFRLGIDRYLTKPIQIETLLHEIGDLLEQGKSRKKVMVVDEDKSTIQTLAEVLQSQGYQVVEANGTELVKSVLDSKPDIILLNSLLSENHDIIKSIRFEKGMENVLFLIYQ